MKASPMRIVQFPRLPRSPPSWVIEGIGTINGLRAVAVERAYIGAWFDAFLRHRASSLLRGPSPRYPEVVFAH